MKKLLVYIVYLLIFWGSFRYFFDFADVVEELWFKPVIWLVPLFWWNASLKQRVTFFEGSILKSSLYGLLAGCFYWLATLNFGASEPLGFDLIGVAVATAVVEEMAFSGFVLGYMLKNKVDVNNALFLNSLFVAICRLPVLLFVQQMSFLNLVFVLSFVFASALINGLVRQKSGSVVGSVVARIALNVSLLF